MHDNVRPNETEADFIERINKMRDKIWADASELSPDNDKATGLTVAFELAIYKDKEDQAKREAGLNAKMDNS